MASNVTFSPGDYIQRDDYIFSLQSTFLRSQIALPRVENPLLKWLLNRTRRCCWSGDLLELPVPFNQSHN